MHFDEFVKQSDDGGVVVRHDEQVDRLQVRARLHVAEGVANVTVFATVADKNLQQKYEETRLFETLNSLK